MPMSWNRPRTRRVITSTGSNKHRQLYMKLFIVSWAIRYWHPESWTPALFGNRTMARRVSVVHPCVCLGASPTVQRLTHSSHCAFSPEKVSLQAMPQPLEPLRNLLVDLTPLSMVSEPRSACTTLACAWRAWQQPRTSFLWLAHWPISSTAVCTAWLALSGSQTASSQNAYRPTSTTRTFRQPPAWIHTMEHSRGYSTTQLKDMLLHITRISNSSWA